jgi:hypothetical protein
VGRSSGVRCINSRTFIPFFRHPQHQEVLPSVALMSGLEGYESEDHDDLDQPLLDYSSGGSSSSGAASECDLTELLERITAPAPELVESVAITLAGPSAAVTSAGPSAAVTSAGPSAAVTSAGPSAVVTSAGPSLPRAGATWEDPEVERADTLLLSGLDSPVRAEVKDLLIHLRDRVVDQSLAKRKRVSVMCRVADYLYGELSVDSLKLKLREVLAEVSGGGDLDGLPMDQWDLRALGEEERWLIDCYYRIGETTLFECLNADYHAPLPLYFRPQSLSLLPPYYASNGT